MLDKFIEGLQKEVENHSIYVWGAQGQSAPSITEAWIRKREKLEKNANRAIAYWKQQVSAGYGDKLRAFDCSGIGIYYLMELGLRKSDTNANGLMGLCERITSDKLVKGCWVFRTYQTGEDKGKAYHIGYVVDDELNVIEARGRDCGVVKLPFNNLYWDTYGIPSYFKDEIKRAAQEKAKVFTFTKVLKRYLTSPIPYNEEVKNLQTLLTKAGYPCGDIDGKFGEFTEVSVKAFQKAAKIKVDGIVGKQTIQALGAKWSS